MRTRHGRSPPNQIKASLSAFQREKVKVLGFGVKARLRPQRMALRWYYDPFALVGANGKACGEVSGVSVSGTPPFLWGCLPFDVDGRYRFRAWEKRLVRGVVVCGGLGWVRVGWLCPWMPSIVSASGGMWTVSPSAGSMSVTLDGGVVRVIAWVWWWTAIGPVRTPHGHGRPLRRWLPRFPWFCLMAHVRCRRVVGTVPIRRSLAGFVH